MYYQPERYRRERPFAKRVATLYRSAVGTNPPTVKILQQIFDTFTDSYNKEICKHPVESRPTDFRLFMKETNLALYYGEYCAYGRNLFHLLPGITEEFINTDINMVPISAIQFPYDVFYISFGPQKKLSLYGSCMVDGAYVFSHPGMPLEIALTTIEAKPEKSKTLESWVFNPYRYYYLPLETANPEATFGELIETAVKKEIYEHRHRGEMPGSGTHFVDGNKIEIIEKNLPSSKFDQEEIAMGENIFRAALRLVVNTLCYVSQYPEEIEEAWPEGTPKILIKRIESPKTPKQARKAKSQLISMGYSKIKLCGKSLSNPVCTYSGVEVCPHWRRGHWRHQPYGKGKARRKLVWIRPTVVRKDKGEPHQGHIYSVDRELQHGERH